MMVASDGYGIRWELTKLLKNHRVLFFICFLVILDAACVIGSLIVDLLIMQRTFDIHDMNTANLIRLAKIAYPWDFKNFTGKTLYTVVLHLENIYDNTSSSLESYFHHHLNDSKTIDTMQSSDVGGFLHLWDSNQYHELESDILLQSQAAPNTHAYDDDAVGYIEQRYSLSKNLMTAEKVLHYTSIGILSSLVLEKLIRIFAFGSHFLESKLEMFDAFVVTLSWVLDLVFVEGIWKNSPKDTALILTILLPWRIIRIVNCFIINIQEQYLIQIEILQDDKKKSKRKVEYFAHQCATFKSEIEQLRCLAAKYNISENEIIGCSASYSELKRRRSLQHNHHDKDHFRHHNKRHTSASFCSVALEDLDFSHLEHTVTDVSFTTILNNERNANGMMKNESFNSTTKRGSEISFEVTSPDECKSNDKFVTKF